MIVRFTRLDPTHHRFEAIRTNGECEVRELETRSLLTHDFVHFALESEGKFGHGFYGSLARGASYETEAAQEIEFVVGPLQNLLKSEFDAATFVERFRAVRENTEQSVPAWLTADLITRTTAHFQRLQGQWRATPFGQTMELRFDY